MSYRTNRRNSGIFQVSRKLEFKPDTLECKMCHRMLPIDSPLAHGFILGSEPVGPLGVKLGICETCRSQEETFNRLEAIRQRHEEERRIRYGEGIRIDQFEAK